MCFGTAASAAAQPYQRPASLASVDPASVIDVSSFAARAEQWHNARVERREAAISRAQRLAAITKWIEEEAKVRREAVRREAVRRRALSRAEAKPAPAPVAPAEAKPAPAPVAPAGDEAPVAPAPVGPGAGDHGISPPSDGPTAEEWHDLRHCESHNDYRAVSKSGTYRGAYQFSRTTWDWVAESRYPHLIGADPVDASRSNQDRMAYALHSISGDRPWPVCGRHLR